MNDDEDRDHSEAAIRPGYFKCQIVPRGAWVPAAIFRPCPIEFGEGGFVQPIDRFHPLQAARDADFRGRLKEACDPYWVWLNGTEIDVAEFQYWIATRVHVYLHEPGAVDANPRKAIDLSKAPMIRPRRRG